MTGDGTLKGIEEAIIGGDKERSAQLVEEALAAMDPLTIIQGGMMPAMEKVGNRFSCGEIFLPEMLMASEAWKETMKLLKPKMLAAGESVGKIGTVVIGTVQTDVHEIGKNIVATLLSTAGFEVHDLGVDISASKFIQKAEEVGADIIAASAIMTTTMTYQRDILEHLMASGLRDKYIVLVGGGVVNQKWADEIGADGYGGTAVDGVRIAKELLSRRTGGG
ncbi:MAG: B12-binding domain-containing protein [Thermodesulfobacteriota bacterium]